MKFILNEKKHGHLSVLYCPGYSAPPVICGYNTGQHMWVPASDSCNQINIDIDTGSTTTTRKWQIKVTQYDCGNLMMPEQDCLQYHTASSGSICCTPQHSLCINNQV